MANITNVTIKATETGISVTADSGFNEVWCGNNCLGYVKGPGERSFPMKQGKYDIVVYWCGSIVLRKTVTVGAEPKTQSNPEEAPQESGLTLDRLIALKAMIAPLLQEIEQAIEELRKGE